ncbi:uncharacterized protein TM35_000211880 [Trypanosoma theileri]|uniref:Uncharacterized protein n=1 Tax=Trypanosoma theileri TaxID=67003 RepID=A0A1X0NSA7_9TRYP|nr:uncharacterized protein TM35_000211880 [Trypanosoma theileri]ORC87582.1 hypothetical protein TM35_000211880 [Trypanosoma theileri]
MAGAGETWFLGGAKSGVYKTVRNRISATRPAQFGTVQEFCSKHNEKRTRQMLFNSVKMCPKCGKPCAVTLSSCNRCNASLGNVGVSETPNLFSAFILGIENSGTFPLKISIRHETESILVFDDPLALSPAHFCAIPTTDFIPDWRYLLYKPKRGLELVKSLVNACHKVLREQFLESKEWKMSVLQGAEIDTNQDILMGFNYPPSQNQLHVQYITPPLMPHQYNMHCRGQHFTFNRFFPISYVEQCLGALIEKSDPLEVDNSFLDLSIDDLVAKLDKDCGISYKDEHSMFFSRVYKLQEKLGRWTTENFEGVYQIPNNADDKKGKLLFKPLQGESFYVDEPLAIGEEKKKLQNYGRDYDENGNPSGGFYAFPKSLDEINMWC